MSPQTNHSLSVDCVIFGFDGHSLKVLLVEREFVDGRGEKIVDYKLPGNLIFENEDLRTSAYRTLAEYTSTRDIYLRQLHVFSRPDRVSGDELRWLNEYYRVNTTRVVTVAYYSLVKLDSRLIACAADKGARWFDVESVNRLAMDHKTILAQALEMLNRQLMTEPIAFELLSSRFTLRQLQMLYEAWGSRSTTGIFVRKCCRPATSAKPARKRKTYLTSRLRITRSISRSTRKTSGRNSGSILSTGSFSFGTTFCITRFDT